MNYIKNKKKLNSLTTSMVIDAPLIANKAKAGQFIILKISETGERIPLTISDFNKEDGTITIIYQKVGKTTYLLDELNEGDYIQDVVGPLGKPTELTGYKNVLLIAGGTGTAIIYPQAKTIKEIDKSNKVDIIAGFKNKDSIILEEEMIKISDKLTIATDDGSYGTKGFVTDVLKNKLDDNKYDLVVAIGPLQMMKAVSNITKEYNIKTIVSMNPIMIDGTGMCGGCRVKVNGKFKFACIDGPDFDGHTIDFDDTIIRLKTYEKAEREASCNLFKTVIDTEPETTYLNKNNNNKNNNKRTKIIEQSPITRQNNFSEVSLGYNKELAKIEASRCLGCKNSPCVSGCPVNINIPEFINYIKNDDYLNAYKTITKSNSLPAICGRVCLQEKQCESKCVRGIKGEPIGIGYLERFVADWYLSNKDKYDKNNDKLNIKSNIKNRKKVAIIGSGPSGLTCAAELNKLGYDITVFEALHKPGGVLSYGIPEFRLPKSIVEQEVNSLKENGIKFETNTIIGKTLTIDDLWNQKYNAIYIASGAGLPKFMGIEGEQLIGVYSANEFLTRINLMKAYKENYDTPILKMKSVAVIGGGNVAMDAARCAKRLGADNVYVIYRRSENEMPARLEEVNHAKEENIEFKFLSNPLKILGNNENKVIGLKCIKMMLSNVDESGRKSVIPIDNSEFTIDIDSVIMAIGSNPNPIIRDPSFGISIKNNGCIITDDDLMTNKNLIFAGGDAVSGAATVILAMEAGKKAAFNINQKLK